MLELQPNFVFHAQADLPIYILKVVLRASNILKEKPFADQSTLQCRIPLTGIWICTDSI
jgi:hypothetical protein